jgi:molecular chaperone HscA
LRILAEQAKCILSDQETFEGILEQHSLHITRSVFDKLIEPLIGSTLQACKQALSDAGCTAEGIDEIVLVGGSTRVPLVITRVSDFFNREVRHSIDPDQVVALGAAIQADILAGNNQESLLLDVTPLSLGIETAGGLMDVLIPRNSKIPSRVERQYSTQKDGQTGIVVAVFQGERDLVVNNRELARFILRGIPLMPAGFPKIQVIFQINADGILSVTAKELRTGIQQSIQVNDRADIDDLVVENMIEDSILHAEMDIKDRKWLELKVEAESLLIHAETLLEKSLAYIEPQERIQIADALKQLKDELNNKSPESLQTLMDQLNLISRPVAERVMDGELSNALRGKFI